MTSANSIDPGLLARAAQALAALVEAARLGGEIAMRDFASGAKTGANINYKDGGSPVTSADLAVDRFLRARLSSRTVVVSSIGRSWACSMPAPRMVHGLRPIPLCNVLGGIQRNPQGSASPAAGRRPPAALDHCFFSARGCPLRHDCATPEARQNRR
jgi:hypothetical protein